MQIEERRHMRRNSPRRGHVTGIRPRISIALVLVHTVLMTACTPLASSREQVNAPIAITHVAVVDVEHGTIHRDQTVIVAGNRVTSVVDADAAVIPSGAYTVDGNSQYLIPGLWDMHVHLDATGRQSLGMFVAAGVTGVRDMGSPPAPLLAWRDSIADAKLVGPRMRIAGTIVESAGWRQGVLDLIGQANAKQQARIAARIGIRTPADAVRAVDSVARLGGEFIKVRTEPNAAAFLALLRAAKARGLAVSGHAPTHVALAVASDSGMASIEHSFFGVLDGHGGMELDDVPQAERRQLFERFARNQTAIDPTMVALRNYRLVPDSVAAAAIRGKPGSAAADCSSPQLREFWSFGWDLKRFESPFDWPANYRSVARTAREMHDAGVMLLAGTDAGVPLVLPGFSVHEELALLVREAGLTPAEALKAATFDAATFMRATDSLGSVAAGKLADLVLLDANPLESVANLRRIRAVVANGRLLPRKELDALPGVARCRSAAEREAR